MGKEPTFKMRFVGFKEDGSGELKPTSPGGFKHHEIRELPFEYSLSMWWEIVDGIPDLVVPEPRYEDSVFIEEVFVPSDDEVPMSQLEDKSLIAGVYDKMKLRPEYDALSLKDEEPSETQGILEEGFVPVDAVDIAPPHDDEDTSLFVEDEASKVFIGHSGDLGPMMTVKIYPEIPIDEMTVKDLKALIKQQGGEVDSKWRKAALIREAQKLEESSSPT